MGDILNIEIPSDIAKVANSLPYDILGDINDFMNGKICDGVTINLYEKFDNYKSSPVRHDKNSIDFSREALKAYSVDFIIFLFVFHYVAQKSGINTPADVSLRRIIQCDTAAINYCIKMGKQKRVIFYDFCKCYLANDHDDIRFFIARIQSMVKI